MEPEDSLQRDSTLHAESQLPGFYKHFLIFNNLNINLPNVVVFVCEKVQMQIFCCWNF